MRSILATLAVAAVLAMLPMAGIAADYQLVGFSAATANGGTTISGFTAICQAEFGSTTRMCNSVEVMETVDLTAVSSAGDAWVRPVYVAAEADMEQDASGLRALNSGSILACTSGNGPNYRGIPWVSSSSDDTGLIVLPVAPGKITFAQFECDSALKVACCGPVSSSMATVPAIMWFGRGLLGAMMLSIAAAGLMYRRQLALASARSQITPRR